MKDLRRRRDGVDGDHFVSQVGYGGGGLIAVRSDQGHLFRLIDQIVVNRISHSLKIIRSGFG